MLATLNATNDKMTVEDGVLFVCIGSDPICDLHAHTLLASIHSLWDGEQVLSAKETG